MVMFNLIFNDLKGELYFWLCLLLSLLFWGYVFPDYFVPLSLFGLIFGRLFFEIVAYRKKRKKHKSGNNKTRQREG